MAERAQGSTSRPSAPRVQSFGTAAVSARNAFAWIWSRESLLRLALSFVLSVALWLYITEKQDPGLAQDFPQPLPIETINVGPGLSVRPSLSSVHIRYRSDTPGALVTSVNFHPIVSLAGMKAGPPRVLPVQVLPDPGLHVVQVNPATVTVTIDRIETRMIAVTPVVVKGPPGGYSVGKMILSPTQIRVKGPEPIVSLISGATVAINLSQVTTTLDNLYTPVLRDGQGAPLKSATTPQVNPPQIQVRVPISSQTSMKLLPVLVPLTGQVKAGFRVVSVTIAPQEVVAQGSPSGLAAATAVSAEPVHVTARKATFTTRVQLRLPKGLSTGTVTATVTIGIQPLKSK